jgi:MFS family permease
MGMVAAVSSAWALLLGIALVMLANGLQGTLLGLRATLEGFSTTTTSLVMTGYFVGFLGGSVVVPRLLRNVGHIRVFAALASLASGAALLHAVFVQPVAWGVFRLIHGFCYSGLYVVAESWLNDVATNETRGQLLSVYMVIVLAGMGAGQFLLNVADPQSFELFVLVSVLVSFALVPISLTCSRAPAFEAPAHVGMRQLYSTTPLGVVGALLVGVSHGTLFGMGAVYAKNAGFSVTQVSVFMAAIAFGGLALQWPIGRISDRVDRRKMIMIVSLIAAAAAVVAGWLPEGPRTSIYVLVTIVGGMSLPLYSLCIAHANDHLAPAQVVAASATLVLVAGVGLSMGPTVAAALMNQTGPDGYFWTVAMVHAAVSLFALYRMARSSPLPLRKQRHYAPLSPRTSPVAVGIAHETMRDHRDRDLARMSRR